MRHHVANLALVATALLAGCGQPCENAGQTAPAVDRPVVLFSVTSGAVEDPHAVTMALQLAGHSLDDGRDVVLFFNVRGVAVPTKKLPEDLAFHDKPIRSLLAELVKRGAEVHVCPHCMAAMEVKADDLIPGAVVTDREKLFSKIGSNTVVFTY